MHGRLEGLYACSCGDCEHDGTQHLALDLKDRFKPLLTAVEKAFKILHKKGRYLPEDLETTPEYLNVIRQTNGLLSRALEDNDLSEGMVKSLEGDIWMFSGLKTHAELFEASRQLLTEDRKIKSFARFSKDVQGVKESHRKYLEAEHDFAVGSVLMAERWDNFTDSERYYLQYRTAADDRVRKSHQMLHNTTLPKDDPFWDRFFPPNGWRCRCTTVEVLASFNKASNPKKAKEQGEKATSRIGKGGKNKLEIFRFNPGKSKVVFPPTHPYHKVQGADKAKSIVLALSENADRYGNVRYKEEPGIKNNGVLEVFIKGKQNKPEFVNNKKALRILANKGGRYRMLPVIEDGKKNPDAFNLKTKAFVDVKVPISTNGKNIMQGSLKEASRQGAKEIVLRIINRPDSYKSMYAAFINTIKSNRNKNIKTITVIFPDRQIRQYDVDKLRRKIRKG